MAAKALDSGDIKKQEELQDITTCIICTEVFTDPIGLPCFHTFCMKCLRENGIKTNKGPGDEMPCPICRRPFKIPDQGFPGLPKHFFIERLIQLSKVSDPYSVAKVLCSVCLEESKEQPGVEIPTADTYCVECKHNLCEECRGEHKKFKLTKNHKLIPISENSVEKDVFADIAPNVCDVHEKYIMNVYCADCKTVECAICFIEHHNSHKGSDVDKCVDGFRKQIQINTEVINGCIIQAQVKKTELLKVKDEIQDRMKSLECDVQERKDKIKEHIDRHAGSLLQRLSSEQQSRLKEVQMATDDTEAYISHLKSYNSYCQKIVADGSASDICRALSDLSFRASELQQQCQPVIEVGTRQFKMCFRQSELELLEQDFCNLVGEVEEEGDLKPKKPNTKELLTEQFKEIAFLKQEYDEMKANCKTHLQEMEKNRRAINSLQDRNDELKQELDTEKSNNKAQLEKVNQELESNKTAMSALQVNNDELRQELNAEKAITISIQTSRDKLNEELEKYKATLKTYGLEINVENLSKQLVELKYKSDPVLVCTIRTKATEENKKGTCGLTILDKELFVVSCQFSEVEVYDAINLSFSRRWKLKELTNPSDIGSCNRNKCLYVIDIEVIKYDISSTNILRIDPNGKLINKWSIENDWRCGLSVTDESNVIVAVNNKHTLNEYSPDGQLIREINLLPDIRHPYHAIQLTNGDFLVSHGSPFGIRRVCIVDAGGTLKKSFSIKHGSDICQMSSPNYLSIDGNGFVFVSDPDNQRVLLFDSDLKFKREMIPRKVKPRLHNVGKILLDESNGRFLVVHYKYAEMRILIFDFNYSANKSCRLSGQPENYGSM